MDVGIEFSHFRVIEHIGRGGMADVWSARDTKLNRTVAIKTVARDISAETEPIELFKREAQTIAQLEHPHILPIYDFGEFEGQLYIAMRYVTGGSLDNLLSDGPLATEITLRNARAIAGALDYAHVNNVIHLDLKPSNILLDSNQSPYLADFGLATVLGPEGRAANPGYGTLLYMAPEQLTSGEIDHRADIYSFTILVYQMLTGELPFDATTSLALKQLQWQEDLPNMTTIDTNLSEAVMPILRRGTAVKPEDRPNNLAELIRELEQALGQMQGIVQRASSSRADDDDDLLATIDLRGAQTTPDQSAMIRREAADLYNKARRAWAYGQGRFLLGVTHFMVMNDFYMQAESHGLELDEPGMQMLLRGAVEYGYEVDHWWNRLNDDNRRWVMLHAIRSENAPARVRALRRLQTLPDTTPPKIATSVAQVLAQEINDEAKRAAIELLSSRAKPAANWQPTVFQEEVDELLAEIALKDDNPQIATLAARTIGRIRSLAAVKVIAAQQASGNRQALQALALVRDEAPSLPPVVSTQGRVYAWLTNTWRRLTDNPLGNVSRFYWAFLGATIAMALYVFTVFRSEAIFNAERWGNTISIGLTFGLMIAILTLLAAEVPARLRGFWPRWLCLLVGGVLGFLWGTLAWGGFTWFFLNYPPSWDVMMIAGFCTMLALVLSAVYRLNGLLSVLFTALATFIPIYIFFQFFWEGRPPIPLPLTEQTLNTPVSLLYFDIPEQVFSLGIPVVLIMALGIHAQAVIRAVRQFIGLKTA
jgi:hypothetical protein